MGIGSILMKVLRQPNYYGAAMLFALIVGSLYFRHKIIYNKNIWAALGVIFCFIMVSGQIWNHMKNPRKFENTKNGPGYINRKYRQQFVYETYIVGLLNAAVVIGMILMIESAGVTTNRPRLGGKWQRFQSVVGLILVCVFFSILLSVFRSKRQWYPYSFIVD